MTQTVVKCLLNLTLLYSALMLLNRERHRGERKGWRGRKKEVEKERKE